MNNQSLSPRDTLIPISIISNSLLLREGLGNLLAQHIAIQLIGCYPNSFEPEAILANPPGHIVLLDSNMGQAAALIWTKWWRQLSQPAHVLVMELAEDKDVILACIEAGANGYTLQGASAADVAEVIRCASTGRAICSPEITAQLFARLAVSSDSFAGKPKISLTTREHEVLQCLAKGFSNKEIASALFIQLYTVKNHVHNILEKMDVTHRRDAVRFAVRQGWLLNAPVGEETH